MQNTAAPLTVSRIFAEVLPAAGFEARDAQEYMAYHVEQAIEKNAVLLAEAGVGTGKTFAYLIPILAAYRAGLIPWGASVLISTNTIVLQHQLMGDIERLADLLGVKVFSGDVVLAKGRTNYMCLEKAYKYMDSPDGPPLGDELREWIDATVTADKNEAPPCPDELWEKICVDETCACSRCPSRKICPYLRQRDAWRGARFVVTNHQQMLADALNRESDPKSALFRTPCLIVIDEAHRFEEAAYQMLGSSFAPGDLKKLPRLAVQLEQQLLSGGGLSGILEGALPRLLQSLKSAVRWDSDTGSGRAPIDVGRSLRKRIAVCLNLLHELGGLLALADTQGQRLSELNAVADRVTSTMEALLRPDEHIAWAQMSGKKLVSVNTIPRDLSDRLHRLLWSRRRPVVLTSATLTAGGPRDYGYLASALGIRDYIAMKAVGSPFDFRGRRLVYLPPPEKIPPHDSEQYLDYAADEISALAEITAGRTLVLLTSHEDTDRLSRLLAERLPGYRIMVQGQEQDAVLLQRFKEGPGSLLLGTAYWEGVDIPGHQLVSVVIVKLPFPPPDPVLEAKQKEAAAQGLDPFVAVDLSLMLMKLKQGVGRLIRTAKDYGVVAVLDGRAHPGRRQYSELVQAVLSPSKVTSDLQMVRGFLGRKERKKSLQRAIRQFRESLASARCRGETEPDAGDTREPIDNLLEI